jgi:hypothetical protein
LRESNDPARLGAAYGDRAAPTMKMMAVQSANVRVFAIFLACLAGNPRIFWWFEIVPLTALLAIGLFWHRRVEGSFVDPGGATAANT